MKIGLVIYTTVREVMSAHQETLSVDTHVGDTVHIPLTHKKSPVVGGRSEVPNTSAGAEFLWRGQVLIATTC